MLLATICAGSDAAGKKLILANLMLLVSHVMLSKVLLLSYLTLAKVLLSTDLTLYAGVSQRQ